MEKKIDEIMNDLYILDSSMDGNRDEMKAMIREIMESRPDTRFDPVFDKKLKKDLGQKISIMENSARDRKRPIAFIMERKKLMGIAAVILLAVTAVPLGLYLSGTRSRSDQLAYDNTMSKNYSSDRYAPISPEGRGRIADELRSNRSSKTSMDASKPMKGNMEREEFNIARGSRRNPKDPSVYGKAPDTGGMRVAMESQALSRDKAFLKKEKMKESEADDNYPLTKQDGKEYQSQEFNTEQYNAVYENDFLKAVDNPLSTFSIDVDTASYSNIRRFLAGRRLPPRDSVRIEEMINYFKYDYPLPESGSPFSITTEIGQCPWNKKNLLVHIGLKGREIPEKELPPSNLVFLIDVSGSMNSENKLGLIKKSFEMLIANLAPRSRVAIVVYAGATGLVLPSTPGGEKEKIMAAIMKLEAGGPTAGSAGISLAYKVASENFIKGGNNRIILATDGDFNIGQSSDAELTRLIEEKRNLGIFLTVLGYGMGNYKDSKLESLADKGNGNYAYIDSILEAKKVMSTDLQSMLFTIAKDVKIQVEFNPAYVESYRLIGYENRMLKKEDFNDDKKDAGELGSGHTVTALYEIVPAVAEAPGAKHEELKYQESKIKAGAYKTKEMMTIKLRYKDPDKDTSRLITRGVNYTAAERVSENFIFASAVAEWGLLLKNSKYRGDAGYSHVIETAKRSMGSDKYGYRSEFIRLVKTSRLLDKQNK